MKKTNPVKISGPMPAWAMGVIRALPAFDPANRQDGLVSVDGRSVPVRIEAKQTVDAAVAHAVVALAQKSDVRVLVVSSRITRSAQAILDAHDVAYLDGLGNASIRLPGVLVRTGCLDSEVAADRTPALTRLAGKAGLIAQVLLLDRKRSWRVADVAHDAGVSTGLAHRVLARLEGSAILSAMGAGPNKRRLLVSPAALLDLWAEEDRELGVRRTAAYALTSSVSPAPAILSARLRAADITHEITGLAAAAILAPALTSVPVTHVRVSSSTAAGDALSAMEARPADEGANVLIVQARDDTELRLRQVVNEIWLAADTRIYLDALRDPRRGKEQAKLFRESVLAIPG